jgi:hypothetical protein
MQHVLLLFSASSGRISISSRKRYVKELLYLPLLPHNVQDLFATFGFRKMLEATKIRWNELFKLNCTKTDGDYD